MWPSAEWIVLAGWMHVLSDAFLRHFPGRVINLHPALPGQFPGTNAIERAFEAYRRQMRQFVEETSHLVEREP